MGGEGGPPAFGAALPRYAYCLWLQLACGRSHLHSFSVPLHDSVSQVPGSADAELAQLNLQGLVDVVVADGEHALLFGAVSVLQR